MAFPAGSRHIALLLLAGAMTASPGGARMSQEAPAGLAAERPPGEGVLCAWAIAGAVAEFGRQCRPGRDPALQAELDRSLARFEVYIVRNSEARPEQLVQYRRAHWMGEASEARLCRGDLVSVYQDLAARGPETLRRETDRLLARPGRPAWGNCL